MKTATATSTSLPVNSKLAELMALEAKTNELRAQFIKERDAKLPSLYTEVGFESTEELIAALKNLSKKNGKTAKVRAEKGERKARVSLTPERRAALIVDLSADKNTNEELAAKYDISTATVQNIKKEAGMVKSTAASAPATPATVAA